MRTTRSLHRASRRALFIGALWAVIVFGGALVYLMSTRPTLYRAEGGDAWFFARYEAKEGQGDALARDLSAKVRALDDVDGFWGMEILRSGDTKVTVLTRWRTAADYERFQASPRARDITPDPELTTGPPTVDAWRVIAR